MKEKLEDYAYVSTFDGVRPMYESTNSFQKFCWIIVIICAFVFCYVNVNNLIDQYKSTPITTQTQVSKIVIVVSVCATIYGVLYR